MTPKKVVKIRKALGLTQEKLAEAIGIHRVTLARWETGATKPVGAGLKNLREVAAKAKARAKR